MKRLFSFIATLLLVASLFTSFVTNTNAQVGLQGSGGSAQTSTQVQQGSFSISRVEVDGVEIDPTDPAIVNVERGDSLQVRVELLGHSSARDVKVKAEINGYEYGDIKDQTSLFDVEPNTTYIKNLVLQIPNDLEVNGGDEFTLHIEASNRDERVEFPRDIRVRIEPRRHALNFVDVIFNPGLSVKNTQPLFVTVRVENLGDKKEEDIRVEVAIPELGISQRTFIDELVPVEKDDDEETSSSSDTLMLDLSNVAPGVYNLRVKVDYNRGHDFIARTYQLTVTSGAPQTQPGAELMVRSATTSMTLAQGGSATYTFSVANLGTSARTLNFEVTGQEAWATAKVEPMAVTVLPNSSREIKVTLNAKSDADLGSKVFTVRVKEGNAIVQELQFDADVQKSRVSDLSSLRSGLEIGFIVLLVILVILGIILAINKLRGPKEEGGESYY